MSICEVPNQSPPPPSPPSGGGDSTGIFQVEHTSIAITHNTTFLQTTRAEVDTNYQEVRVLFDNCSSRSYINQDVCDKLRLQLVKRVLMIAHAFEKEDPAPRLLDVVTDKISRSG